MFIVFLHLVVLLCFCSWNNTVTVNLLHWPHVSGCILCWPFDQFDVILLRIMFMIESTVCYQSCRYRL